MSRPPGGEAPPLDTTTDIETPEHVRFRYRIAGPWRRALAYLVDLAVMVGVGLVVGIFLAIFQLGSAGRLEKASTGVILVLVFLLQWGYFVLSEALSGGRSLGKRAAGLRVVREGGYPLRFTDSVLRNLLRAADFLPSGYALGGLVMGLDRRFRRLGDLVAGTLVVVETSDGVTAPLHIEFSPPVSASELAGLPSRLPLSADELEAIELFLRRRGTLSLAREQELAEMVAPLLGHRLGLSYEDPSRFLALLYQQATASERWTSAPLAAPAGRRRAA
ncbi:MAG TPA: RDD family protein [Polyangia bacterium]|nr:RDD family protein [Polyangia bacterium]